MNKRTLIKIARRDPDFREDIIRKLARPSISAKKILDKVENMILDPISEGEFDFQDSSNKRIMAQLGADFGQVLGELELREDSLSSREERLYDQMNEIYEQMERARIVMRPFLDAVDNSMANLGL